jgi:Mycotoxin biosynthesis protein UstYa
VNAQGFPTFGKKLIRTDHCLDYLRQVIMCNGDLTPNTFTVAPDRKGYIPDFNEPHQCRDFSKIFEWAERRNNGVSIDPPDL